MQLSISAVMQAARGFDCCSRCDGLVDHTLSDRPGESFQLRFVSIAIDGQRKSMSQAKLQALLQNSLRRSCHCEAKPAGLIVSGRLTDERKLCTCASQGPGVTVMPVEQTPGTSRNSRCAQLAVLLLILLHFVSAEGFLFSHLRANSPSSAPELRQAEPTTTAATYAPSFRYIYGISTSRMNGGKTPVEMPACYHSRIEDSQTSQ